MPRLSKIKENSCLLTVATRYRSPRYSANEIFNGYKKKIRSIKLIINNYALINAII